MHFWSVNQSAFYGEKKNYLCLSEFAVVPWNLMQKKMVGKDVSLQS